MGKEEKSRKLLDVIVENCKEMDVQPDEVLEVVGTAVANLLTTIAPMYGCSPQKMLKVFANGIANAELVPKGN